MRDQQRVDQMNEGAAFLRRLSETYSLTLMADDRARIANLAQGMERFASFVLDRDAGPSRDLTSENRRLEAELALANKTAKEIDVDFAAYRDKTKAIHHRNARLTDDVTSLKDQLDKAQKASLPKPTDIVPEEPAKTEG